MQFEPIYRLDLKLKFGTSRLKEPSGPFIENGVLQSRTEWEAATENAKRLGVPRHRAPEKNWDHLAAVSTILTHTEPTARILDAGAELYSNVLPALFTYGYRELCGINLAFTELARRGPIRYVPGDITRAPFADASFDAMTCMSVIEHGVPLDAYFREMHRLLKPGGLLITSTDYFPTPVDTRGLTAYGSPIKIFSKPEIESAISLAESLGFQLTSNLDFECREKAVKWEEYGLEYTFLIFTLRKTG